MSTATLHSNETIRSLREVVAGPGGAVRVVVGERGPFFAGYRAPPAKTLLEAVLAIMGDVAYQRIVAITATGFDGYLPESIFVSDNFRVGRNAGGWLIRGEKPGTTLPAGVTVSQAASNPDEYDPNRTRDISLGAKADRSLGVFAPNATWDVILGTIVGWISSLCGKSFKNGTISPLSGSSSQITRSLVLFDERTLLPSAEQIREKRRPAQNAVDMGAWLSHLPLLIALTPVDVVLLARSASTVETLQNGRFVNEQAANWIRQIDPNISEAQLLIHPDVRSYPAVGWKTVPSVALEPPDVEAPHGQFWRGASPDEPLYKAIQSVPVTMPRSRVRPPRDPRKVAYEFWAEIDIEGLRQHLLANVIGQRAAIEKVVSELDEFQVRSADALRSLRANRLPPETEAFFPPTFMFMGASGMGKTHLAKTIARFLFGSDFYEEIEMNGKVVSINLFGGEKNYRGSEDPPKFLDFCHRTNGMGMVLFDELDKVRLFDVPSLSAAMNPFISVLPNRYLTPNNLIHANHGNTCWFRNLLIIFTANVLETGSKPGYVQLEDFGRPMIGRLKRTVMFTEMAPADVEPAARFYVRRGVENLLSEILLDNVTVSINDDVIRFLVDAFNTATAGEHRQDYRTFRTMEECVTTHYLRAKSLKDKFRNGQHHLGLEDLNQQIWQPVT